MTLSSFYTLPNAATDPYGSFVDTGAQTTGNAQPASWSADAWQGVKTVIGASNSVPGLSYLPSLSWLFGLSNASGTNAGPSILSRILMILVGVIFLTVGLFMLADRKIDITNVVSSAKAVAA